jgi:hypothetical protein
MTTNRWNLRDGLGRHAGLIGTVPHTRGTSARFAIEGRSQMSEKRQFEIVELEERIAPSNFNHSFNNIITRTTITTITTQNTNIARATAIGANNTVVILQSAG